MKTCLHPDCNFSVFSHLYCRMHQSDRTDSKYKPPSFKKVALPKPKKWIAPISEKHALELKDYRVIRDAYMAAHLNCEAQFEGCTGLSQDLHHSKGRGKYLCDVNYFKALCRACHTRCELEPDMAREKGFIVNRFVKEV